MPTSASFLNPKGGQLAVFLQGIPVNILTAGTAYSSAGGGLAVDLTGILAGATQKGNLAKEDVLTIHGRTNVGHTAVFTYSAGATWNMRLYTSGGTEVADGAITQTVEAFILLRGGGSLP